MSPQAFAALHALWSRTERRDEYLGALINAWLAEGGAARGLQIGDSYVDVGTLEGYRAAIQLLASEDQRKAPIGGLYGPPGETLLGRQDRR
jgi:hypothetical protein